MGGSVVKSVRIWYAKTGRAVYISHLDLLRCMTRAVRRARLPLWYTEGFNPHPYLTFPLPLPLGQEGLREPMDIRLPEDWDHTRTFAALSAVLPEGIHLAEVCDAMRSAADIALARYRIVLCFAQKEQADAFAAQTQKLLDCGGIPAEKKTKKGIAQVNLCDFIEDCKIAVRENEALLTLTAAAGSTRNLNAALLEQTLLQKAGLQPARSQITRECLLCADGTVFR